MSKFAKRPNLHRDLSKALMRCASIAAFGVSVVVFAAIRLPILQAATLAFLLAPFGLQAQAQTRDIMVFGAASLKNALDDANNLFLFENAMRVGVSYGASSALAKQIESGAPADVFISADLGWMDYIDQKKLIKPGTRANLLGNKIVLIAPSAGAVPVAIAPNFPLARLLGDGRLAMADPASV